MGLPGGRYHQRLCLMIHDGYVFDRKMEVVARFLNARPNGQVRGATIVVKTPFKAINLHSTTVFVDRIQKGEHFDVKYFCFGMSTGQTHSAFF